MTGVLQTLVVYFFSLPGSLLCHFRHYVVQQRLRVLQVIVGASICWFAVSSLFIYPHSLPYANELIGGPANLPKHLLSSNFDWGQDFRYLAWWATSNRSQFRDLPLRVAYFGGFEPSDIAIDFALSSHLRRDVADDTSSIGLRDPGRHPFLAPGWYAISVSFLCGSDWPMRDGGSRESLLDEEVVRGLSELEPTKVIGASIYLFNIH